MSTPDNYLDCVQGSELWLKLRCGFVTASRVKDVIATTKKGESADRRNYRLELMFERHTGVPYPRHVTYEMQWGLDHEDEAAAEYELATGELVDKCGFVIHPTIPMFGASPDRLVGDKGLAQIKCPTPKTLLEWMTAGVIPVEHVPQMLAELACDPTREWCDFVGYHPLLPIFIRRYHRDSGLILALEKEVVHFNKELDQVMAAALPPAPVVKLLDESRPDEMQF